jgi:hypothetical protein
MRCPESGIFMQSRRILLVMAIEENPSRDGHHVHALWDSLDAPRKATHREWLKRYGRNRIEPVRGFSDVVNYCCVGEESLEKGMILESATGRAEFFSAVCRTIAGM